jgi:hypothetical protein
MFQLLQGTRFIGRAEVRERLREAHEIVRRGLTYTREKGQRRIREVVVSYVDGPGKSGATYAGLYAEENGILAERVVEKTALARSVHKFSEVQALVFVDDFTGTGDQACEYIAGLARGGSNIWARPGLRSYFLIVAGFGKAQDRIQSEIDKLQLPIQVRVCMPLGEEDRFFSERSAAFPDPVTRVEAEAIARRMGAPLLRQKALGWGNLASRVVFESSIPNNAPPILWAASGSWTPLFPRY